MAEGLRVDISSLPKYPARYHEISDECDEPDSLKEPMRLSQVVVAYVVLCAVCAAITLFLGLFVLLRALAAPIGFLPM
jgi:hypothetical protein